MGEQIVAHIYIIYRYAYQAQLRSSLTPQFQNCPLIPGILFIQIRILLKIIPTRLRVRTRTCKNIVTLPWGQMQKNAIMKEKRKTSGKTSQYSRLHNTFCKPRRRENCWEIPDMVKRKVVGGKRRRKEIFFFLHLNVTVSTPTANTNNQVTWVAFFHFSFFALRIWLSALPFTPDCCHVTI